MKSKFKKFLFALLVAIMPFMNVQTVSAANTVKSMDYVAATSAYKTGKATNLSSFQAKTWKNGATYSGKYTFVKKNGKINGHSAFDVKSFTGSINGVSLSGLTAKAGCTIWGAADWPTSAKNKQGNFSAKVYKSGTTVKIVFRLAPPNGLKQATTTSGSGYQHASFYLQFTETPQNGKIKVTKNDSRGGTVNASAATFEVYNSSNKKVATLNTSNGTATSGNLATGKYTVKETKAPTGYSVDVTASRTVTVSANSTANVTFTNKVITGSISLQKKAKEGSNIGDTTLKGAEYTLYADEDIKDPKDNSVLWSKGSEISVKNSLGTEAVQTANENGVITWSNLPNGAYYAIETKAPAGFNINPEKTTFSLEGTSQNKTTTGSTTEESLLKEFYVNKVDDSDEAVSGAKFTVKLKSDVDSQGWSNASSYGTLTSGEDGKSNTLKLPYGIYVVRETFAPEGYKKSNEEKSFTINANSPETQSVTFVNEREDISVRTTATDSQTKTHTGVVGENVTINDVVRYSNVLVDKEYTIKGKLMDKSTGKALLVNGKEVTAEKTFTATETSGTQTLSFTFDSSALAGKSVVVFEDLYEDGKKVATHSELDDADQTVHYPSVKTTATDSATKTHFGTVSEKTTINDVVAYTNLVVGNSYTVKGKLMNKSTNEPLLVDGKEVTAEKTFTATSKNGSVTLSFTFDSTALKGGSVVVFEDLYNGDIKVATHSDINDEGQTVDYPSIKTTATDSQTKTHTGVVGEEVTINDVVEYTNLVVGKEYTVKGKLMDKSTNKALLIDGDEVTAEKTFTAEKANGTVTLSFTFDSSELAGKSVVVFENVYNNNVLVATHSDINDEGQTVEYPSVKTTATDSQTKEHSAVVSEKTTIIDMVKYTNLIVGKKYTVKGKLMDKDTSQPLLTDEGKEITAEKTFTAETKDGSVEIEFTFDATEQQGKTTVVFEDLYHEGVKIATHSDINDNDQTVEIPDLATTATSDDKKSVSPSKETTIIDVVKYTNLIVGKEYSVKGKLMDKTTGKVILDKEGNEITSEETFTATQKEGSINVTFTFDSSHLGAGVTTVVFEDLYQGDLLVISHADLSDKDQTVEIEPILTTIQVNKVDKMTNEIIKSKKFEFTMYSDKECTTVVARASANESEGTASFKNVKFGTYYIKETKAPTGYELSNEVKEITLNENTKGIGDVYSFVYYNTPLPTTGVKTGDNMNIAAYIIAATISFVVLVGYFVLKMRNKIN